MPMYALWLLVQSLGALKVAVLDLHCKYAFQYQVNENSKINILSLARRLSTIYRKVHFPLVLFIVYVSILILYNF